jgi:hypothetical protein
VIQGIGGGGGGGAAHINLISDSVRFTVFPGRLPLTANTRGIRRYERMFSMEEPTRPSGNCLKGRVCERAHSHWRAAGPVRPHAASLTLLIVATRPPPCVHGWPVKPSLRILLQRTCKRPQPQEEAMTRCLPARVSLPGNRADVGTLGSLLCVRQVAEIASRRRVGSSLTL